MSQSATSPAALPPAGALQPLGEAQRIIALDVLRGFALLGILMVNMQVFAMPIAQFFDTSWLGSAALIDVLSWGFVKVFCEYKFIALFSLLFGAGFAMQMTRAAARGRPFVPVYLRRLLVLALIGLAHGILLWYGDILFVYAGCGLLLLAFGRLKPQTLFITGGAIAAGLASLSLSLGVAAILVEPWVGGWMERAEDAPAAVVEPQQAEAGEATWSQANPETAERWPWLVPMLDSGFDVTSETWIDGEVAAYKHGPFLDALAFRVFTFGVALLMAGFGFGWRSFALFLIGAGLMKAGFFGSSMRAWHRRFLAIGLLVGLPLEVGHAWLLYAGAVGDRWSLAILAGGLHEIGSLMMCFGIVGAGCLVARKPGVLLLPFQCAGRLALSNYLGQTVASTFLMYCVLAARLRDCG